jgi:hypothetical protein
MKTAMALSVLFLSTASITPSFANYFHNPQLNVNRNIGSAPSPTPQDVRENHLPQVRHTAPASTDASATTIEAASNLPPRVASK